MSETEVQNTIAPETADSKPMPRNPMEVPFDELWDACPKAVKKFLNKDKAQKYFKSRKERNVTVKKNLEGKFIYEGCGCTVEPTELEMWSLFFKGGFEKYCPKCRAEFWQKQAAAKEKKDVFLQSLGELFPQLQEVVPNPDVPVNS